MLKTYKLKNNIKLIYHNTTSPLTSVCIGLEAGAAVENEHLGIAHLTEHILYKSTENRNEAQINVELSEIFAFQNAMTNYPYVIYYGTMLKEEFSKGIQLFSDILLKPSFSNEGFEEEKNVVIQELSEWDEETEQYCEDRLFYNVFENRLKYPIIGTKEQIDKITIEDIKSFYQKYYYSENTTITVVSSIDFDKVKEVIEKYFSDMKNACSSNKANESVAMLNNRVFVDVKDGINNSRVEIIFPIDGLDDRELYILRIFEEYFGVGVNSVLYNELRTKRGLVYDVMTKISYEKNISLYKICLTTSEKNVQNSIDIIKNSINNIHELSDNEISRLSKKIRLKKLFREEQGIVLAKELTVNSLMGKKLLTYEDVSGKEIIEVMNGVFKKYSIQIINPKE